MKTRSEVKVIIIGAGSHALVIADMLMNIKGYRLICFLEKGDIYDTLEVKTKKITQDVSFPVLPDNEILQNPLGYRKERLILGIGQNLIFSRGRLIKKFKDKSFSFCSVIHPKSTIATSAAIGEGGVIMAGAIINSFAKIGNHVVINTGAVVDHNCTIGDNTFVQPGAHLAGNVYIEKNSIIGIGANVKEDVRIGSNTIIGGGAFVNKDVPNNVVYAGVPAAKLRDNLRKGGCQ